MEKSSNYLNKENGIGNCPFCRGVILKNFKIEEGGGKTKFVMRCPHCLENIQIDIQSGNISISKFGDGA